MARDLVSRILKRGPGPEMQPLPTVLILTPLKDAWTHLFGYWQLLDKLTYRPELISIGFLESDSTDDTWELVRQELPKMRARFRRADAWKRDFGFRLPEGVDKRDPAIQMSRRSVLARSRNHLLLHSLQDEEWVLWIDVDLREYPPDIIERLLATGKTIVQPHCVLEYGGATFDQNAWRDKGRLHMDALKDEGPLVKLDAVGGTMLLIKADIHRDGLIFPAFEYGVQSTRVRDGRGELETEGLGIMAHDMGHECWGMPELEIKHRYA